VPSGRQARSAQATRCLLRLHRHRGIENQRIVETRVIDGAQAPSRARQLVHAGDTVVSTVRTYLKKTALVGDELDGATASTGFCVLRPAPGIDPRFVFYRVVTDDFVARLTAKQTGSSYPAVRDRDVFQEELAVPPEAEQRRIVAAIEEHFSRLDAAKTLLESAHRRLRVLRRLLLRTAFAGVHARVAIAEVAEIVSGQTPKGMNPLPDGPVPFFKVGDMNAASGYEMAGARAYVDDALIAQYKLKVRPAGTVIFPKRGGAIATNKKRILLRPAAFDLNTMGLVPADELLPKYLLYWLETLDLSPLADGSNVPQINVPDVAPLGIPLPPLAEQRRIVAEVEQQLSLVDAMAAEIDRALKRCAALRRSILEQAFTGKLVPQDPSDEPASVLLERIAAEGGVVAVPSRRHRKSH
jgi:type I restriction enzyme S subunit